MTMRERRGCPTWRNLGAPVRALVSEQWAANLYQIDFQHFGVGVSCMPPSDWEGPVVEAPGDTDGFGSDDENPLDVLGSS